MSRYIDADALKDKLQQHHDFYVMAWGGFGKMPIGEKKRVDEITNCIAEVVNAPTIEPKRGEWIPCEERLPDDGIRGITLYSNGKISGGIYLGDRIWDIDFADSDKSTKIVAWMPLPEPYKTDGSE